MAAHHRKHMTIKDLAIFPLVFVAFACSKTTPSVPAHEKAAAAKPTESILPQIHEDKLEDCYARFLKTKPKKEEGSLLVSWDLNQKGEIKTTQVVQNELNDQKFTTCVMESLKQARFPVSNSYPKKIEHRYSFKRRVPASI
jgi:hypothetical protein